MLLHADLIPGNVLHRRGEVVGLIDFGALTTGDPAYDLTCAWWILDASGRADLRERLQYSDDEWDRGRALAVVQGALASWYYTPKAHPLAALGDRALREAER